METKDKPPDIELPQPKKQWAWVALPAMGPLYQLFQDGFPPDFLAVPLINYVLLLVTAILTVTLEKGEHISISYIFACVLFLPALLIMWALGKDSIDNSILTFMILVIGLLGLMIHENGEKAEEAKE